MDDGRIDRSLEDAPVLDRDGYPYIIHPLMDGVPRVEPGLLIAWAEWGASQACLKGATLLLAPEAMALPLAAALSMKTGIPYAAVRKRRYRLDGETIAYTETGYSQTSLYVNDVHEDDRIVVVDDVVSTGGTLQALLATLRDLEAHVQGTLVFVDKGGQADRIEEAYGVPVHAMRTIHVQGDQVRVDPKAKGP